MREELESILVNKYPELCRDYGGNELVTCFAYGFECGDGWFNLIDDTLSKVDTLAKSCNLNVKIDQIKSKLGELRLYINIEPGPGGSKIQQVVSQIHNIIDVAIEESSKISEISGKPATRHSVKGWIYTATEEEIESIKNRHEI